MVTDIDEAFADLVLSKPRLSDVDILNDMLPAIRRATLARAAVPVLCGSSLKNRGVQPLLNLICEYLPNPTERQHVFLPFYKDHFCGLAFKIAHDRHKPLTFIRVYSGELRPHTNVHNASRGQTEFIPKLFVAHSDQFQECSSVPAGNIGVVAGLNHTVTGDTLVETERIAEEAADAFATAYPPQQRPTWQPTDHQLEIVDQTKTGTEKLLLVGIEPPDPVYFCSVEPPSASTQVKLDGALGQLVREDPSLRVNFDSASQQTIIQAMGELHLEIIKDRLKREWGLDVFMGPLQISYKEYIEIPASQALTLDDVLNQKKQHVSLSLDIRPNSGMGKLRTIEIAEEKGETSLSEIRRDWLEAVKEGCLNACKAGPLLGYPVQDVSVSLRRLEVSRGTNLPMISSCASRCLSEAMRKAGSKLMEPLMSVQVRITGPGDQQVLADMAKRRAQIDQVTCDNQSTVSELSGKSKSGASPDNAETVIRASAPLAELAGFATVVRTLTSGRGSLHMELQGYRKMTQKEQSAVLEKLTGKIVQ